MSRLVLGLMAGLVSVPAFAEETATGTASAMTEAERKAFRDEVRAYLLENPEVLVEAMDVLQQR